MQYINVGQFHKSRAKVEADSFPDLLHGCHLACDLHLLEKRDQQ